MKIEKLRVNHLTSPLGYRMEKVSFSWAVTEAKGKKALRSRVEVAKDPEFFLSVFDSGEQEGLNSLDYAPEIRLEEGVRYYWRVSVRDDEGDFGTSSPAWFETAGSLEKGQWIQAPFDQKLHPLFRKELFLKEEVKSARLLISGLGLYEAYLNGEKVGDEYLAPFYNDYNLWTQYQTYDVTDSLRKGENVLGVMMGNGWYMGRFGFVDGMDELYGNVRKLICELQVSYRDGSGEIFGSDESWLCAPGPVLKSSIYDGEVYDARKEILGWAKVGPMAGFVHAVPAEEPLGELTPRLSLPVKIMETLRPAELITTPAGEQVIDFGQILTGWVEFDVDEPEGKEICFQFGEILQEGNFYNENLRTAKQEYRYISDGKKAHVRPHFTFYGFRYMKVTGISSIRLSDFTGCVIYSEMEQTGTITTSNPKINRLFLNALWGQKGNFLDVPTDCPQRDERMGWTGDAQVFSATACYNMYTPAFFRKYLYDMKLEQDTLNGGVPHVVPDILGQIERLLNRKDKSTDNVSVNTNHSSCAWADAATIIPWNLYRAYGDKTLLQTQYRNMKDWTDYIRRVDVERCGGKYLWTDGFHYGDWLALDNYHQGSSFGATDNDYVASVYYFYSATLTGKAAKVLGLGEDAAYYEDLAARVKAAIQEEFFTKTGRIAVKTQTAMVLALYFDLVPGYARKRLIRDLREKLKEDKEHLTTGFVGTGFLCAALAECGMADMAYTLLLNEDYPSWLYEVNMGATTIWERWNSVLPDGRISDTGMNSLNHYSYGSIVEWMYRYMCGVSVKEDRPGFAGFTVKPYVDGRFDWVRMEFASPKGRIVSSWEKTDGGYAFHVEVPFDTEAEFELPMDVKELRVNDQSAGTGAIRLEPGIYEITAVI